MKQHTKPKNQTLFSLGLVEIILLCKGVLRGVFLANHLASTDHLTIQTQTNVNTKVAIMNNNIYTKKTYANRKDTAWFTRLLRHPARKWSGSIFTTPEPTQG